MTHKADIPTYDGQELFIYQGMLVYVIGEYPNNNRVELAEFMGRADSDIYVLATHEFNKLPSATPENLDEMGA